jgi:hypothetical protein
MKWAYSWIVLSFVSLQGCSRPLDTSLSSSQRDAGAKFASQYEMIDYKATLKESDRRLIENSFCSLLVPDDWVQTGPTHFQRKSVEPGTVQRTPEVIKLIEYPSVGGSLEAAIHQFSRTARAFVENYHERKRWSTSIDGHPAVAVCYEHTEQSSFPGQVTTTKAFFTVKHDPYDRERMHTVIINCTAPKETFESLEPLFDEIACRTTLIRNGT